MEVLQQRRMSELKRVIARTHDEGRRAEVLAQHLQIDVLGERVPPVQFGSGDDSILQPRFERVLR